MRKIRENFKENDEIMEKIIRILGQKKFDKVIRKIKTKLEKNCEMYKKISSKSLK